jgi:hypothetical protein
MRPINHRVVLLLLCVGQASNNAELPSRPRPNNRLASYGCIRDLRARLHILVPTLPALICRVEAPAVDASVRADGEAVVAPRRAVAGLQIGDLSWSREDAGFGCGVVDQGVGRERRGGDSGLETVHPAPDQACGGGCHAYTVVGAPVDVSDCAVFPGGNPWDDGRVVDIAFGAVVVVRSEGFADAGLAVGVQAPRVDDASGGHGEGVVGAAADGGDRFALEAELRGGQAVEFHPLDYAPAELVLLARAPGEDGAGGGEGEDVIGAAG